jgi:hypothetical protein
MVQYLYETDYDEKSSLYQPQDINDGVTSIADCSDDSNAKEPIGSGILSPAEVHIWVYLIADKYTIPGLKKLAKNKIDSCLEHGLQIENYISVIKIIYSSTSPRDPVVRSIVTQHIVRYLHDFQKQPAFLDVLRNYPDFTYDFSLLMMEFRW